MLLQQGSAVSPSALSSRISFLSGLALGLLIYTAYSATLVSFLAAADQPVLPFADLRGMLEKPDWRAGWKKGDLLENFLDWCRLSGTDLADCETLQQVYNRHVQPDIGSNLVSSYDAGFRKVAEGNYAFLAPNEAADYWLAKMDPAVACRVSRLPAGYVPGGIALGLQRNSPYRGLFNRGINQLNEGGVIEKLYRNVLDSRRVCESELTVQASLLHTMGAFCLLALGGLASLLVLAGELAAARRHRLRRLLSCRSAVAAASARVGLEHPSTPR